MGAHDADLRHWLVKGVDYFSFKLFAMVGEELKGIFKVII